MKQFKTIFLFEYYGYVKNRKFQIMTLVMLAIIITVSVIPQIISLVSNTNIGGDKKDAVLSFGENVNGEVFGISELDAAMNDYTWRYANSGEDLRALVENGTCALAVYYNGGDTYDFYTTGRSLNDLIAIDRIDAFIGRAYTQELIRDLGEDAKTAVQRVNAMQIHANQISISGDFAQNYGLAYALVFILYMVMVIYNQFIMTSVITEKTSKTMEILITSAKPSSLMFGKVFGVGAAALTQLVIVFMMAVVMFFVNSLSWQGMSETVFAAVSSLTSSPFMLASFLIFFLLGYFMYSFLFAAFASTVSRIEDAGTVTVFPMMMTVIGFMASIFGAMSNVDSILIKVLSFIPFFSPMVMFTRLCMNSAQIWEVVLAMVLTAAGVALTGFLSAKIYKTGVNLYGKAAKPKDIFKMLMRS